MNYIRVLVLSATCLVFLMSGVVYANNISVSDAYLVEQDPSTGIIKMEFDIGWENSWRDVVNNDACWIFVKYSTDIGATWNHATLKTSGTNPSGCSIGSGTGINIIVPSDKKGCFVERSDTGSGTLNVTDVRLVWDYANDGVSAEYANDLDTRVKIFAIEMVKVPEYAFSAGDSDADVESCFKAGKKQSVPISISSENAVNFNNEDDGPYYYQSANNSGEWSKGSTFTVSNLFPKGFKGFYIMKYEISQGQWIDFFNTLADSQKTTRDITSAGFNGKTSDSVVKRNAVSWTSGDAVLVNEREYGRACNYLSWMDLAAYADWACLRVMTELEYEKACRGPAAVNDDEYAWGSTSIQEATQISGTEDGTETVSTAGANACFNDTTFIGGDGEKGPLRCGIFSDATSGRTASGGSYYGVMELSGNLWERCVTIGNPSGLSFEGTHGDGLLTSLGNATNTDWPGIDAAPANGVTGASGAGFRGGSWYDSNDRLMVADRGWAARTDNMRSVSGSNYWGYGGRCCRTAP